MYFKTLIHSSFHSHTPDDKALLPPNRQYLMAGIFNNPSIAFKPFINFFLEWPNTVFCPLTLPARTAKFNEKADSELKWRGIENDSTYDYKKIKADLDHYRESRKNILVGHSWGGLRALLAAEKLVDAGYKIDAIVIMMGLPPRNIFSPKKKWAKFWAMRNCFKKPIFAAVDRPFESTKKLFAPEVSDGEIREIHKEMRQESNYLIYQLADMLWFWGRRPEIDMGKLSMPILFIGASQDFLIEAEAAHLMFKSTFNSDYAVFDTNHHYKGYAEPEIHRFIRYWLLENL